MHVLAAPDTQDPRDGGFVNTLAGEWLFRPFVCDTGREGNCGCERSMAGMLTRKGTTLVAVVDSEATLAEYIDVHAAFLVDAWGWEREGAEQEARTLAEVAADFPAGALITVQLCDDSHVFDELDA